MKIVIEKVCVAGNTIEIEFASSIGGAVAEWVGDKPAHGQVYDVEIDIDEELIWGKNINTTKDNKPKITFEGGQIIIVGELLSDQDHCLSIAIDDSFILLDIDSVSAGFSGMVECKTSAIRLFPTNI